MYRIQFDTRVSKWVVQVLYMGLIWRTCHREISRLDAPVVVPSAIVFDNIASARSWVKQVGLDQAYHEQTLARDHFASALVSR